MSRESSVAAWRLSLASRLTAPFTTRRSDDHRREEAPWHASHSSPAASRGIGAAISKALKAAGYTVAANYAGNDEAADKFKAETGIPVYKWSVADYDACAAGIKQVEADLGPVDILVNNAGITRDGCSTR